MGVGGAVGGVDAEGGAGLTAPKEAEAVADANALGEAAAGAAEAPLLLVATGVEVEKGVGAPLADVEGRTELDCTAEAVCDGVREGEGATELDASTLAP